jgi:hypothetical protein
MGEHRAAPRRISPIAYERDNMRSPTDAEIGTAMRLGARGYLIVGAVDTDAGGIVVITDDVVGDVDVSGLTGG